MINRDQVKWIQVEATTKCNAWCPGCGRNQGGFGLAEPFEIVDLAVARLEEVLCQLPLLEVVHFCGTFGDAIAAQEIHALVKVAKQHCKKIQLNTNGSLRTTQWWTNLALELQDIEHDIWFCLDGLKDTHEIYRQGTDFDKIIANARAFIDAGGSASWQFIPWKHNEHQISDCIKMSQRLGFKNFRFINNVRSNFQARHYQTGESVNIVTWSKNQNYSRFANLQTHVPESACMHLTQPSVYLNADGKLSSCCWINQSKTVDTFDQLPNIRLELTTNPQPICLKSCGVSNA